MPTERTHLGALLRGLRYGCKPDVLQSDVASALNVSERTVRNWERSAKVPTRKLAKLLDLYGASDDKRAEALRAAGADGGDDAQ